MVLQEYEPFKEFFRERIKDPFSKKMYDFYNVVCEYDFTLDMIDEIKDMGVDLIILSYEQHESGKYKCVCDTIKNVVNDLKRRFVKREFEFLSSEDLLSEDDDFIYNMIN